MKVKPKQWEFGLVMVKIKAERKILNKEFGSTYPEKLWLLPWTIWEWEKVAAGGCTGVVIKESHLVLPVLLQPTGADTTTVRDERCDER